MASRKKSPDEMISIQLKQLLSAIEASGHAVLPLSNDALLKSIVEAAARIFNAAAASILLVIEEEQVLEFKVAYGGAANLELVGMRFPLDKGIAGYVVMTGQPLAVSNVRQDPRFNQDFARSTGYVPSSILATPLLAGDRVIGVMEVLDKVNSGSFGMQDMEILAIFAHQAALAIDQSQKVDMVNKAIVSGLEKIMETEISPRPVEFLSVLNEISAKETDLNLLAIADLFNEISKLGETEKKACLEILKIFARYSRTSNRTWL